MDLLTYLLTYLLSYSDHTHIGAVLKVDCWFGLGLVFEHLFMFSILCVILA